MKQLTDVQASRMCAELDDLHEGLKHAGEALIRALELSMRYRVPNQETEIRRLMRGVTAAILENNDLWSSIATPPEKMN